MENNFLSHFNKIVNPSLALTSWHTQESYGQFKAYIQLAHPETHPHNIKLIELGQPGFYEATIPCSRMEEFAADDNIVSIELREYIARDN
jgi:hypothetical protein